MKMPFTRAEFLQVFEHYNEAVWPLQVIFYALALFAVLSLLRKNRYTHILAFSLLALLWIWMGTVYHLVFFSAINRAATVFGLLFIVQGLLFVWFGVWRQQIALELRRDVSGTVGVVLIVYALILYPVVGWFYGHGWPDAPTFGVPCPTTIFTFGILLFAVNRVPWYLVVIPFLWSLVGLSAAINLSIPQDYGLVIAGVVSTVTVVFFKPRARLTPEMIS